MSVKWTRSQCESGILRKSDKKEKKEELFVFGYSCKLFRDDEKAIHVDQGKHLIPWMGDDTLKIDRYDARGALHDLSALEAPPGGFDWRVELTRTELDVEQLCDEERYRALHTDEDEEEMYREEELKRLHAAGYGQVGFNYETPKEPESESGSAENDDPFIAPPALVALLPDDVVLPDKEKLNAIIDKTAKFIAGQGAQMEILLRAKQKDNAQFKFLNKESPLHAYYMALIALYKAGKWPEKPPEEPVEEKHPEHNEEYLHPSLGSTIIESAPSIPSIHYRPSADCDYTMLISKIRGSATLDEPYEPSLAPGEVPPPGTRPLHLPPGPAPAPPGLAVARAPVIYPTHEQAEQQATQAYYQQYAAYYQQYMAQAHQPHLGTPPPAQDSQPQEVKPGVKSAVVAPGKSTGLSLMKNYNTDSDSDASDFDDTSSTDSKTKTEPVPTKSAPPPTQPQQLPRPPESAPTPPEDVRTVIDKMAAYVARNGNEFADIVRAKNDPRFLFLEPSNEYHGFYLRLMREKRGDPPAVPNGEEAKEAKKKKSIAPVSFSIKKLKEPEPVLPKPALPYESSSEDESDKKDAETKTESPNIEPTTPQTPPITNLIPKIVPQFNVPPPLVYKTEAQILPIKTIQEKPPELTKPKPEKVPSVPRVENRVAPKADAVRKERTVSPRRDAPKEEVRKEKRYKDRKEYRSMSESRDLRRERSAERERKKHKEPEKEVRKKSKYSRDDLESEIISLEDNSDEMIDLTGEDSEAEKAKQRERRQRAAEFLKKVGVDPAAAALPTSSLASAMVDTLETLRKKKVDEEEKRRKRERKKRKHDHNGDREHKKKRRKGKHDDDGESDHDSSKKKKRKKDKKSGKSKRKRRREVTEEDAIEDQPLNIDLHSTLKELRTTSPTRDLGIEDLDVPDDLSDESENESSVSGDRDEVPAAKEKKKKKEREYSEGEWSSDSEEDSPSSTESV